MRKLIIVRHGETVDNVSQRIQGQQPGQLTSDGYQQAEHLGLRLSKEKFEKIFSSDLARVRETTAAIIKHHTIEPEYRPELRERAFGEFEGRTIAEYQIFSKEKDIPFYEVKPPGGESILELVARARSFLDFLIGNNLGENILLSAHGTLNRALILSLLGWDIERWQSIEQDNTCINTFFFKPDGTLGEYELNCTAHLSSSRNVITVTE